MEALTVPTLLPLKIELGPVVVRLTTRSAVVARRDREGALPHLTLLWGTRSNEFDIHLTWEDGRTERHEGLWAQPHEQVAESLRWIESCYRAEIQGLVESDQLRRVRPGWLERRGYVVMWVPQDEFLTAGRDLVYWTRQRYVVRHSKMAIAAGQLGREHVYRPSVLHVLPQIMGRETRTVIAPNLRGRGPSLVLNYFTDTNRGPGWYAYRVSALTDINRRVLEAVLDRYGSTILPVLNAIHDKMELADFGHERPGDVFARRPLRVPGT